MGRYSKLSDRGKKMTDIIADVLIVVALVALVVGLFVPGK